MKKIIKNMVIGLVVIVVFGLCVISGLLVIDNLSLLKKAIPIRTIVYIILSLIAMYVVGTAANFLKKITLS